jgi:hypothetical protein
MEAIRTLKEEKTKAANMKPGEKRGGQKGPGALFGTAGIIPGSGSENEAVAKNNSSMILMELLFKVIDELLLIMDTGKNSTSTNNGQRPTARLKS